ncbi:MAG: hypothetical protein V4736_00525, partial [Bdellovibrionota bacterium]
MNLRSMFSGRRFLIVASTLAGVYVVLVAFQNCSKVSAVPVNPEYYQRLAAGIESDDMVIGEDDSTTKVKIAVIADNSQTMANSNIKLKESFGDFFDGIAPAVLNRMDLEIVFLNTAQTLPTAPSNYQKLSSSLTSFLTAQETSAAKTRSIASTNDGSRLTIASKDTPGDILGFRSAQSGSSLKEVKFLPAPVRSLASTGSDVIRKVRDGSVNNMKDDFLSRLEILTPARLSSAEFADGTPLGDSLSQESGTCALARLLNEEGSFFSAEEIPIVLLLSDEDDKFRDGKTCVASIQQNLTSKSQVMGTCEGKNIRLKATKYQSKFDLGLRYPAKAAYCKGTRSNMFTGTYKYRPIMMDYKETRIKYYKYNLTTSDGQTTRTINTTPEPDYVLEENISLTCDVTRIKNLVLAKNANVIVDNPTYPITCAQTVKAKTDNSYPIDKTTLSINGNAFVRFNHPTLAATPVTQFGKGANCPAAVLTLIGQLDPELSSGRRQLDTTTGTCKIADVKLNDAAVAQESYPTSGVTTVAQCQSTIASACLAGQNCVYNSFFAGSPVMDAAPITIGTYDESINCNTLCSATTLCKSRGAMTVQDYLASTKSASLISCASTALETAVNVADSQEKTLLTCDTPCNQTKYCASSPLDTVRSYIGKALPSMKSCDAPTDLGGFSVAFGPRDPDASNNYCSSGNAIIANVDQSSIVEKVRRVSEANDGTIQDLNAYIKRRFSEIYGSSPP